MLNVKSFLKSMSPIKQTRAVNYTILKPGDLVRCKSCEDIIECSTDNEIDESPGFGSSMVMECCDRVYQVDRIIPFDNRPLEDWHVTLRDCPCKWMVKWLEIVSQ